MSISLHHNFKKADTIDDTLKADLAKVDYNLRQLIFK